MANWVRYPPPPFLSTSPLEGMRSGGAIPPPQKGYLSDTCAIPYENKANGCDTPLCDTISKGYCAIWGGISHRAAKAPKSPESLKNWSAANGGLRDGGLRKSEDIRGKRPFSSVFWIFQVLLAPSGKGEKGRKRAILAAFGRFPVSHFSAIGATIPCDAPYSAIGWPVFGLR